MILEKEIMDPDQDPMNVEKEMMDVDQDPMNVEKEMMDVDQDPMNVEKEMMDVDVQIMSEMNPDLDLQISDTWILNQEQIEIMVERDVEMLCLEKKGRQLREVQEILFVPLLLFWLQSKTGYFSLASDLLFPSCFFCCFADNKTSMHKHKCDI